MVGRGDGVRLSHLGRVSFLRLLQRQSSQCGSGTVVEHHRPSPQPWMDTSRCAGVSKALPAYCQWLVLSRFLTSRGPLLKANLIVEEHKGLVVRKRLLQDRTKFGKVRGTDLVSVREVIVGHGRGRAHYGEAFSVERRS